MQNLVINLFQSIKLWLPIIPVLIGIFTLFDNRSKRNSEIRVKYASKISVWIHSESIEKLDLIIHNGSQTPIYNVTVFTHRNVEDPDVKTALANMMNSIYEHSYYEILPPGDTLLTLKSHGASSGNEHDVPSIWFTDALKHQWYYHADGWLTEESYLPPLAKAGLLLKHVGSNREGKYNSTITFHKLKTQLKVIRQHFASYLSKFRLKK